MKLLVCALLPLAAQAHDIGAQVTWSREISRLLERHCASCHREGGVSFPLATFDQAKAHAKEIGKSVRERTMPPFGAVKGFGDLREDESLTQEQIELFVSWIRVGAPEGDPALIAKSKSKPLAKPASPPTGSEWIAGPGERLGASKSFVAIRAVTLKSDSVRVAAKLPDGTFEPLIWFYRPKHPRTYFFKTPLVFPAGTEIASSPPGSTVALLEPAH